MNISHGILIHIPKSIETWPEQRPLGSVSETFIAFGGIYTLYLLAIITYRLFFHSVSHIPGPFLARCTELWRTYRYFRGNWLEDIVEVHRKYGPIVRIAPNELSIVDIPAMKKLYGHGSTSVKTNWYKTWSHPSAPDGVFEERDKKIHAFKRKRLAGVYSMTSILKFEKYIQTCLDLLLWQLKKHADGDTVVNMSEWTSALAFDVVGELSYGAPLGHLRTETDVLGIRHKILEGFYLSANVGYLPGQSQLVHNHWVEYLRKLVGKESSFALIEEWTISKIQNRMDNFNTVDREDMLSYFIKMKSENGGPASLEDVLMEAFNIIGAGADTTSIGMRAALRYICSNTEVYEKVRNEVDCFYLTNHLTNPITYQQTQQLPYLVAACKEAMRFHPSIVWQLPRYAPEGFYVGDKYVPSGTAVGLSPAAQNRDPKIFHPDPDTFRPERWFESEEQSRYLDSMLATFGGNGPRMCMGRHLAMVEIQKFIAQLIYQYDVSLVNPERPWHVTSHWFAYQHDLNVRIRSRPARVLRMPEL